jgi:hypothetical protein
MRRLIPAIVVVVLYLTPSAWAKELPVEVCGQDGCVRVADPGDAGMLHSTGATRAAPAPAPFYVIRFRLGPKRSAAVAWSYVYVPSAKAMRGNDYGRGLEKWMGAQFLDPLIRELANGLNPFPACSMWSPAVHSRRAAMGFDRNAVFMGAVVLTLLALPG